MSRQTAEPTLFGQSTTTGSLAVRAAGSIVERIITLANRMEADPGSFPAEHPFYARGWGAGGIFGAHLIDVTKPCLLVSCGAGQDSVAIVLRLAYDRAFRHAYAGDANIAVAFADPGDEHDETYQTAARLKEICARHGFVWAFLTADLGYHSKSWRSLEYFYRSKDTIGSSAYPKTCSPNLKSDVIYRWYADFIAEHYGGNAYQKRSFYDYTARFGEKLRVIIGLAAGEERRKAKAETPKPCDACEGTGYAALSATSWTPQRCTTCKGSGIAPPRSLWFSRCIERIYPLIDEGMDRAAAQAYIRSVGEVVPPPSNCFMCPFADARELLWKAHKDPVRMARWIVLERAKRAKHTHMGDKNFGVYKEVTLDNALIAADVEWGWMTMEQLELHRMSHGHCTLTAA